MTACRNYWYWAAETFFWAPSSSSSSIMDLSLTLSSESRAAKKFTGEASLGGESDDEDLLMGEQERVDSLVSSNPLILLTGVLGRLSGVLGGVLDLLGGVSSSLGVGTVDLCSGLGLGIRNSHIRVHLTLHQSPHGPEINQSSLVDRSRQWWEQKTSDIR